MNRARRGFTLIEVLVALFVIALGVGALLTTLVASADSVGHLRDKSMGEWIALNRISELRLASNRPRVGVSRGNVDYGGARWNWEQRISDPGIAGMLRIEVSVALIGAADGATPSATPSDTKPDAPFPAVATAYGFIGTAIAPATGVDPDWSLAAAGAGGGGGPGGTGGTGGTGGAAGGGTGAPSKP